jgi:hypothetical protein
MSAWKPIETAPKDGTPFDMWGLDPAGGGFRMAYCFYSEEEGGFLADDGCSLTDHPFFTPTHWMPLPAPPAEA